MTLFPLTATALSYHSQNRLLLDKISLTLNAGQKVVLTGRSGSGKSLLLQALNDLLPLSDEQLNKIMLNNKAILHYPPTHYRAKVILFHQTPNLIDGTVLDNLQLPFSFRHHQNSQFNQQWHLEKLKYLGKTESFLYQSITDLSGGERQIVAFLQSLQLNPSIALFDEITAALDDETAACLMDLVLEWHDDNKAFIWITHNPSEQEKLKATIWQMENGRLSLEATNGNHA